MEIMSIKIKIIWLMCNCFLDTAGPDVERLYIYHWNGIEKDMNG
jgi:hypothetical protein